MALLVTIATLSLFIFCSVAQNIGDLRLTGAGSNSTAGRLEIFYTTNSSVGQPGWGTISAVNFSKSAADVACHQLGYSNAESFFLASTTYGVGSGPVWLIGPNCTGNELHTLRCWWNNSPCPLCFHINDVAICCNSNHIWNNPFEGSVHLLEYLPQPQYQYQSNGELLVYLKGLWGAVCADHFTKAVADLVCRQLGYTDSNGYQSTGTSGNVWLKVFDCSASEPCFTNCYDYPVNSSWITDCSSGTVDVSCEYDTNNIQPAGTDCQVNNVSFTTSLTSLSMSYQVASTLPSLSFSTYPLSSSQLPTTGLPYITLPSPSSSTLQLPATGSPHSTLPSPSSSTLPFPPSQLLDTGSEGTNITLVVISAVVLIFVVAGLVVAVCIVVQKRCANKRQHYIKMPNRTV